MGDGFILFWIVHALSGHATNVFSFAPKTRRTKSKRAKALEGVHTHILVGCFQLAIKKRTFMDSARDVLAKFNARFHSAAKVYRAPGRVNLTGEHTDYNDGFVLPAAIGFSCWVATAPREDRRLALYSENFDESVEADLDDLRTHATGKWADYVLGVAWVLEQAGHRLRGANLYYIFGEVPLGAGLSSSAAVEVSTGFGLMDVAQHRTELKNLALLCQRAENEFGGARCGIMDQFVSCHGRAGNALLLDCRSLDFQLLRLPSKIHLVICNTMVEHKLRAGEYNVRRTEREEGVRRLSKVLPGMRALRDVSQADLEINRNLLGDLLYKRCCPCCERKCPHTRSCICAQVG
jgi:galactokinase